MVAGIPSTLHHLRNSSLENSCRLKRAARLLNSLVRKGALTPVRDAGTLFKPRSQVESNGLRISLYSQLNFRGVR